MGPGLAIDELGGMSRRSRFVCIDAALGDQKYGVCPTSTASMCTNRGRRLMPRNQSMSCIVYCKAVLLFSIDREIILN